MLALLPLLAVIDPGMGATLLGWSADGQYLVWTTSEIASSMPKHYFYMNGDDRVDVADPDTLPPALRAKVQEDDMGVMGEEATIDETVKLAVVHDARGGADQKFVLSYKADSKAGKANGALKKKYAGMPDAAAFDAWKKQHPLAKPAGKKGAKGAVAVDFAYAPVDGEKPAKPGWKKSSITWSVENGVTVTLATSCGKERASEAIAQEMAAMYTPTWTATPIWDPSGHRVLFVLEEATAHTMRGDDGGRLQYVVVPCGPRVDVVAPAGLEKAAGPVADAVEKAGLTVVSIGTAKAARTQTVVYADGAHTDIATKLASGIPGGATVDKLTWKPKADIVVAIGDSAK